MPAYNAELHIEKSIDSVINQTFKNWELIVIDDGSTDTTSDIVKQKMAQDERIRYLHQENCGPGSARDSAIKISDGDLLAFLDADDLWLPSKLEISVTGLLNSGVDLLFTDAFMFSETYDSDSREHIGIVHGEYYGPEGIKSFLTQNRIPTLTVLLKKNAYFKTEGFKSSYIAEDYDLWLQLLNTGCSFKSIDQPLSAYRIHDESLTKGDRRVLYDTILVIKEFLHAHPEYAESVDRSLLQKIKYWLYNSTDASTSRLRILISGLRPTNRYILPYLLSYFLPFKLIRKLINNTILKNVY